MPDLDCYDSFRFLLLQVYFISVLIKSLYRHEDVVVIKIAHAIEEGEQEGEQECEQKENISKMHDRLDIRKQ